VYSGRLWNVCGQNFCCQRPGYEHRTRHINNSSWYNHRIWIQVFIFWMLKEQYKSFAGWFLSNNDLHAFDAILPAWKQTTCIIISAANQLKDSKCITDWNWDGHWSCWIKFSTQWKRHDLAVLERQIQTTSIRYHEKAVEYMRQHFSENISLKQLSHMFCKSFSFQPVV